MDNSLVVNKRLASLAVFRELYDSEKDIYGIISSFLTEIIITNKKHQFSLHEIAGLLNDFFNFSIPDAVIKTSLARLEFLDKDGVKYTADLSVAEAPYINSKKEKVQKNNELIIKKLFLYIEEQKGEKINETEKEKIISSFCSFLLDKSTGQDYTEYISAFIINNEHDLSFTGQLNTIKEGIVLYTGIMFNDDISTVGSWNTELTIFLDTEMLFHLAGYNGGIHEALFLEFFSYVKEINIKASKPLIKLKYFVAVKDEIEHFFKKAEDIVDGKEMVNPEKTAMISILNGCSSRSDIVEKKTNFFRLLSTSGIHEDEYQNYFDGNKHKYNILDKHTIQKISESIGIENIEDNLGFLNFISIHRKEDAKNNFENIGYILLSGNSVTTQIAWHELVKPIGIVPLATTLDFLTNKFWFKLNKGFGDDTFPKTFNVITKAQILLSAQLNKSVGYKFEELQEKFRKGELTEDQAATIIITLKDQARKPEDIKKDDLSFILHSTSQRGVDTIIEEQVLFRQKANKRKEENEVLNQNLLKKEQELAEKDLTVIKMKRSLYDERKRTISSLRKEKEQIDKIIGRCIYKYKLFPILLFVSFIVLIIILINKYGWDKIEPWTYILGLIILVIPTVASLYFEKTYNPKIWLQNKVDKCKKQKYLKYKFDENLYESLIEEIEEIK